MIQNTAARQWADSDSNSSKEEQKMNNLQKILASLALATAAGCAQTGGKYNSANVAREHTGSEVQAHTQSNLDSIVSDKQITPSEMSELGDNYVLIKNSLLYGAGLDEKDDKGVSIKEKLDAQKKIIEGHFDAYLASAGDSLFVDVVLQYNKQDNKKIARGTDAAFNFEKNRTQGMNAAQLADICSKLGVDKYELLARMASNFQSNSGSHPDLYNSSVIVNKTNFGNLEGLTETYGSLVNDTKVYDKARIAQLWNNQANDDEYDTLALKVRSSHIYEQKE
jgi:hypothetical protein